MRVGLAVGSGFLALLAVAGCKGSLSGARQQDVDPSIPVFPHAGCPVDPDCSYTPEGCEQYYRECQDYFICRPKVDGYGQRCESPGPDLPDGSHEWTCEDTNGSTVCTGDAFPDGGSGGDWQCETQHEFVVCTKDNPDYPSPDAGGDGPWTCWFSQEFRICESNPPHDTPPTGGGFSCVLTDDRWTCTQTTPPFPDDGEWNCYFAEAADENGDIVCTGGDLPDDGGGPGWSCETAREFVVCTFDNPDFPDSGDRPEDGGGSPPGGDFPGEGTGGPWDCRYAGEFVVCEETPPDGGGGECVPGSQRWCDGYVYCAWGKQTCLPDGSWGSCQEPDVGSTGLTDRPNTACGCHYFYYNPSCCETPDCVIPEGHEPPACEGDGSLCSFCDRSEDCGGGANQCILTTVGGAPGYAFCGQDCSSGGTCPSGFGCEAIGTWNGVAYQCVPDSGECE